MAKTQAQWMAEALNHMKQATWTPERWAAAIMDGYAGHEYDFTATHNYKAQVAMWNAAHPQAPNPAPAPTPAPVSLFSGKGSFTTSEPAAANGLSLDWVAHQVDPEGSLDGYTGSAMVCWWQARATQEVVDRAKTRSIPYIGQAENQAELEKCLALDTGYLLKALVGNAGSWTAEGARRAAAQGWDLIQEWYKNAKPWELQPDAHGYPRFVNVCFGIYSEGEEGGDGYVPQSKSVAEYRAVWPGSFSVWKAEALTDADRVAFNA